MDKDLFLKQLEQFAVIKPVRVAKSGNLREADEPNEIFRNGKTFVIDKDNNSTLNWTIKEVKQNYRPCEDCGKQVVNRRIWRRVFYTPDRHWRTTCSGCNLTQHPETKEYVVANSSVTTVFCEWLNTKDK